MAQDSKKKDDKNWDFFGLNRPQYAATPEVLLTSLAWVSTSEGKPPEVIIGKKHRGFVYKKIGKGGKADIVETIPSLSDSRGLALSSSLNGSFSLDDRGLVKRAARILLDEVKGNTPTKATSASIIPLDATSALMQDVKGVQGVEGPPNFAKIMQRMYSLGGGVQDAAELLAEAYAKMEPLGGSDWFEKAMIAMAPDEIKACSDSLLKATRKKAKQEPIPCWLSGIETPYSWFANAWHKLLTDEWKKVMPRRRWVDWATCVLRTGLGTGYIFEMNFYYQIVIGLMNNESATDVASRALSRRDQFFTWDAVASISSRDVAGRLKKLCRRGTSCRELVKNWLDEYPDDFPSPQSYFEDKDGIEKWIVDARKWLGKNKDEMKKIKNSIASNASGASNNIEETIRYSLIERGKRGYNEDYYSVLRKRGRRYTVVEPGQEWFVVIASLEANGVGGVTRVSRVIEALESLGMQASYKTIVKELERVGLARSSHDADDAIEVAAAF